MKSLQISLPDDVHHRLKCIAVAKKETQANLIREAVIALVEKLEQSQSIQIEEGR